MDLENNVIEENDNQDLTDNSELENSEPSTDDNSDVSDKEPEQNNDVSKDNEVKPFTDLDTANKSYAELQKKLGEQGLELGKLRNTDKELTDLRERQNKFLNSLGYESLEDFENHQRELQYDSDVAKFEANQYLQYLNEAEFPDEVRSLINLYHSKQTPEDKKAVLDSIEANFTTDVIKRVAADVSNYKGQLDVSRRENFEKQQIAKARVYLGEVTNKYADEFKNKEFMQLYGMAFGALGFDLDSDQFISAVLQCKKSWVNEALKAHNIEVENNNATDRMTDNPSSSGIQSKEKDVLDMTEAELRQYFRSKNK